MSDDNDAFDFTNREDFDEVGMALKMMAEFIVPMFLSYKEKGLTSQDAAQICAAFLTQSMPPPPKQED